MKVNWRMGAVVLATTLAAMLAAPDAATAKPRPPVPDASRDQARASAMEQARASAVERARIGAAEADGPNLWSVDPDAAGKCVDVWNWGEGPWIQMWWCHGGTNQRWYFAEHLDNVEVFTEHNGTFYCIDGYAGRGRQLIQYPCDDSNDQRFKRHGSRFSTFALERSRKESTCRRVGSGGVRRGYCGEKLSGGAVADGRREREAAVVLQ